MHERIAHRMSDSPSTEVWRLFWMTPLSPTPAIAGVLTELERWRNDLKIVSPEQLHLTLKFLGDTPSERVADIVLAGRQAWNGLTLPALEAHGVGVFPSRGHPRVIWVGLENVEGLVKLAEQLDRAMQNLGYAPEQRPFQPHLTLARVKQNAPRPLLRWLDAHRDTAFGRIVFQELVLCRSQLTPQGARYSPLESFPLRARD